MPIDLMTSTMKSDPGRPITFSPGMPDSFSFAAGFAACAATLAAARVVPIVVPMAAALFRKSRRSSPSSLMPDLCSFSIQDLVDALVVERARHLRQLVAELALVRR